MSQKVRRVVVFEWKLALWNGLSEKKAIDLFLKYKKKKCGRSLVERKLIILKMNEPLFEKRFNKAAQYRNYLRSKEWQNKRQMMFNLRGKQCEVCGDSESKLEVHHIHYKTLYNERPEDLQVLCSIHHKYVHDSSMTISDT